MTPFSPAALDTLAAAYPEQSVKLTHDLADHPLLRIDALADLAERMRPVDVEYNKADLPIGVDPADTEGNGLSIGDTIRSIEKNGSWMVLKFVEQDPTYRDLLHDTLAALEPVVGPATGAMLKREGFIFISSPGSVTPFHFDPEHNVLLQIRGQKVMNVFPAGEAALAAPEQHEHFHAGGHRNLPWHDDFAAHGTAMSLTPGEAIYVPVKAPHWVKNGDTPSVSLSITWRSEWSFHEEYAHGLNRMLRGVGLTPSVPRRFPQDNRLKSAAYRAIRKMRGLGV